jgi:hypothetical protein
MFSSTTMVLVTRMPTVMPSAISVMTFSVKPSRSMSRKVETMVTGMAAAAMIVPRQECRKRNSTSVVSRIPIRRLKSTSDGVLDELAAVRTTRISCPGGPREIDSTSAPDAAAVHGVGVAPLLDGDADAGSPL